MSPSFAIIKKVGNILSDESKIRAAVQYLPMYGTCHFYDAVIKAI